MQKRQRQQLRVIGYSAVAVLAVGTAVFVTKIHDWEKEQIAATCTAAYSRLEAETFGSVDPKLAAQASFVYDFTDAKPLDSRNSDAALPLASLTKLMTIRVALERVSPDTLHTVTPEDLTSEASIGFVPGDKYAIRELLKAALVASSNNAAAMIAHSTGLSTQTFLADMNAEAQSLDLPSLKYESVTGLDTDNETVATAWGSAHDILMLLDKDYLDYPDTMAYTTHQAETIRSSTGASIPLANTNKAIPSLALLVAGKTGYTDVAGGNLAVLWKDRTGRLLGASVLGSSEEGRFLDMTRLHRTADIYVSSSDSLSALCATP